MGAFYCFENHLAVAFAKKCQKCDGITKNKL